MPRPAIEQAWISLSYLFVDTEIDEKDIQRIAETLLEAGFSAEEARRILLEEVAPVFGANLLAPIGEWAAWPDEHVVNLVRTRLNKITDGTGSLARPGLWGWFWRKRLFALVRTEWERVEGVMNAKERR